MTVHELRRKEPSTVEQAIRNALAKNLQIVCVVGMDAQYGWHVSTNITNPDAVAYLLGRGVDAIQTGAKGEWPEGTKYYYAEPA